MFLEIKVSLRVDTLNEVDARMTRTAYPDTVAEITIVPVMVNQFHGAVPVAQFTALVLWIWTFILNTAIFSTTLSKSILTHIGAMLHAYQHSIVGAVQIIRRFLAWLTPIIPPAWPRPIDMKILIWKYFFAAIAPLHIGRLESFIQPRTLGRAARSFLHRRLGNKENALALRARLFHAGLVPRLLAFLKEKLFQVDISSHGRLNYSI